MKKVIVIRVLALILVLASMMACVTPTDPANEEVIFQFAADNTCIVQASKEVMRGHLSPVSNSGENITLDPCCCVGQTEFICFCPQQIDQITNVVFIGNGSGD